MGRRFVVIGGGIVGLATARELLLSRPGSEVTVLEKEPDIARHQTGRNSGVIHSGIYYPAGSEKAKRCREGAELMARYCEENGIPRKRLGKLIVATDAEEALRLPLLLEQGAANGIPGLRIIERDELREKEPALRGVKALVAPDVEVTDYTLVARSFQRDIQSLGGTVRMMEEVLDISRTGKEIILRSTSGGFLADFVVNCAGLFCDRIARLAGCRTAVRIIPFRGEYYNLAPEPASRIHRLVYPVPVPGLPFLGVHLTPHLDGRVSAGPNAVPALRREGYSWTEFSPRDLLESVTYPGFWRMTARHAPTGLFEISRSLSRNLYARSVRKYLPEITPSDMTPGESGVRAQAIDSSGRLLNDFVYELSDGFLHVLNAPSPAATASLAIARRIVSLIKN